MILKTYSYLKNTQFSLTPSASKWRTSLVKSIQLQLFIALVSLPFLISWGLPISVCSIFSTILFSPFLSLFLLFSSLVFFCELLCIPNGICIYLLEWITHAWLFLLQINQQWWLVGFAKPPLVVLLGIVIITLLIFHSKHIKTAHMRTAFLFLMLLCSYCSLKMMRYPYSCVDTITYNKKEITLITHHNELTVIDSGTFSAHASYESFVMYTLMPDIIKKTGKMTIDHLIVKKINQRTYDALAYLTTKMIVKNIYVPWWTGKIPHFAWSSYVKLKKSVSLSGGKIIPISKKRSFFAKNSSSLFVEPHTTKCIHYYDATYPLLVIKGAINNHPIEI